MKKFLFLVLVLPLIALAQTPEEDIVGKWIGKEGDLDIYFIFTDDGIVYVGSGEKEMGGTAYDFHGRKASFRYVLNVSKNPHEMDLRMVTEDGEILKNVEMIVEFMDKDHIKMIGGIDGEPRPVSFTKDTIIFKRIVE